MSLCCNKLEAGNKILIVMKKHIELILREIVYLTYIHPKEKYVYVKFDHEPSLIFLLVTVLSYV